MEDFEGVSAVLHFTAPLNASYMECVDVVIIDDEINEPCEDFSVSLSSSSDRAVVNSPSSQSIIINDDEGMHTPVHMHACR